ncbi:hypothetical protein [Microseira sp. BLCC-F43]|uniref:hypothetical protein n=1 Tax=Microseira sp. BLCC-F43 TaxID=3153602 RepID=UPI0035B6B63C
MRYTESLCSGSKNGSRYTNKAKTLYLTRLQAAVIGRRIWLTKDNPKSTAIAL